MYELKIVDEEIKFMAGYRAQNVNILGLPHSRQVPVIFVMLTTRAMSKK